MSLLRSFGIRERLSSIIVFSERIKKSKISARVKGSFLGNWGNYFIFYTCRYQLFIYLIMNPGLYYKLY